MAVDGSITIGAIFTTDKFDRQIAKFEKDMQDTEDKLELKLNAKIQAENELKKHKQDIFDLEQEYEKLAPKVERYNELISQSKAGNNLSPKDFQFISQIKNSDILQQYDKMGNQLDRMYAKEERLNAKVQQKAYAYKQVADKVDEYKQKIENVKMQKHVAEIDRMKESFKSVGSAIQGAVKHVARLALGIFGIRSAYMFLRQASSSLAGYDKQYAANIEYIRYALTQMIAPVLQWIVRLAATLLGYINAIVQAWFGINLFSRGSAKNFQKMKAGASGASKAVKEIKKQLAGFDEINMLTDQSDSGAGGGGGAGGAGMPSFDLSAMQGDVPPWLKWIIDNKELILGALAGIAAGLIAIKFGASGILALGIGLIVGGIVALIQDIVKFIQDPSWENFANILRDLAIILAGVAIAMLAVNAANPTAWIILLIAIITLLVAEVIKHWDKIKEVLGVVGDWINEHIIQPIVKFFQDLWDKISTGVTNAWNGVINALTPVAQWIYNKIIQPVTSFFSNLWNEFRTGAVNAWNGITGVLSTVGNWIYTQIVQPVGNFFSNLWNGFKTGAVNAWNGIKNIFSTIGNFFGNIIRTIINKFRDMGARVGEVVSGAFKGVVNGVLGAVERILNSPIRTINSLIDKINAVPGINLRTLPTFNLPRLKVGGIINMPNKGTMVGSAIGGEAGREGVIPLTDQQAMAELGAEIGRHVLVNLTNITQMNGRVIGRELKQVQSEQEFAFNA